MQAVPAGHGLGNLVFLVSGLRARAGLIKTWQQLKDFQLVVLAAFSMLTVHLFILGLHGGSLREFEAYAVWLIWPFVLTGLMQQPLSSKHFFVGLAVAGCVSGLTGLIDLALINLYPPAGAFLPNSGALRVAGVMTNPLVFGNLSLLFATVCLYFLVNPLIWQKGAFREPVWVWYLGLNLGFIGSMLSGSKGGWVAAFVIWPLLALALLYLRRWARLFRVALSLVISFFIAASLPMNEIKLRLSNFYQALEAQISVARSNELSGPAARVHNGPAELGGAQSGLSSSTLIQSQPSSSPGMSAVPEQLPNQAANPPAAGIDSSITPRLVQWRLAFSETSAERLFIGMPRAEFIELQRQALALGEAEGLIRPWRNLHNDLIDVFITKGVLGLLSLLVFVVLLLRFFYCRLNHDNHQIRSFAGLGLLILLMVGLYSISDVQMDKGAVTHTLSFILLCLVALILQASSNSNT
jgi:hypothetical protein